jgi:tetratricopeptide (TPR) repeat protein
MRELANYQHVYMIEDMIKVSTILLSLLSGAFFLLSWTFKQDLNKPSLKITKQQSAINIDSTLLKIASVGNHRLLSSMMWVQTLIQSDIKHYKEKNLNSWMYLRFKTIADLTPRFYENYLYGGQYLSIIKDDDFGAEEIYARGLKYYSEDYQLNYHSAFHFYYELGQLDRALKIYDKIKFFPEAPEFLPSLVARMKSQKGNLSQALELLIVTNEKVPDTSPIKERLEKSIYDLQAEIDLNCLNSKTKGCRKIDYHGNPYEWNAAKSMYVAKEEWQPFRVFERKGK